MIGEGVIITGTIKANSKVTIQGTVDGDEMSGSIDFGGYGGGDWTATRGG